MILYSLTPAIPIKSCRRMSDSPYRKYIIVKTRKPFYFSSTTSGSMMDRGAQSNSENIILPSSHYYRTYVCGFCTFINNFRKLLKHITFTLIYGAFAIFKRKKKIISSRSNIEVAMKSPVSEVNDTAHLRIPVVYNG